MLKSTRLLFVARGSAFFVFALALLGMSGSAQAANTSVHFHGTICQPLFSSDPWIATHIGRGNNSTSALQTVTCPLPIFNAASTVTEVDLFLIDQNPSQDADCRVYGMDTTGTTIFSIQAKTANGVTHTTSTSPNTQLLFVRPTTAASNLVAECNIPYRIGTSSYSWVWGLQIFTVQ
jgi:hypothetical protein